MRFTPLLTNENSRRRTTPIVVRARVICLALICANFACDQVVGQEGGDATRPHVLLIVTDDMGWMDLGCQGNPVLQTPHLDALAGEGVRFTNAYAAAPVCSPTRAALMTGLTPARLRITQHGADRASFWPDDRAIQPPVSKHELPLESKTLAERMKDVGYVAGFFGKWHLGGDKKFWPNNQGFDVNFGGCGLGGPPTYFDPYRIPALEPRKEGEYLTDRLADEAINFMRREHDSPMLVCLWTYNPHYPFEAPADYVAPYEGREGARLKNAIYGGQISATDNAVGRVLAELDQLEIADETLVIFTSDNGGWSGATDNRPLREGKGYLYEGGLRVPLMIRWPGVTHAGSLVETPVVSMDLTATILDAARVELDALTKFDGESLRPLFSDEQLAREHLFFHYPHFAFHKANRPGAAIRSGQYKLIRRFDDESVELYDLENDIGEENNLAAEKPEIAREMKQALTNWLRETSAALPQKLQTPGSQK